MPSRAKSLKMLGKQREQYSPDSISEPKWAATDAQPRHDLHWIQPSSPPIQNSPKPRITSNMREHRNDLMDQGSPIVVKTEEQTFKFPTPSPKAVLYTAEVHTIEGEIPIGMAIGSPRQASGWTQSQLGTLSPEQNTSPSTTLTIVQSPSTLNDSPGTPPDSGKPYKASRWKAIGGLFGRRNPSPQQAFYQLQHSPADSPSQPAASPNDANRSRSRSASRMKQVSGNGREAQEKNAETTTKPTSHWKTKDTIRSRGLSNARRRGGGPVPPPKDVPTVTLSQGTPLSSPTDGMRMLDVEIPSVQLERYSVMFGSLLRSDRSSNLLQRRQANPEKLAPLHQAALRSHPPERSENLLQVPQRRATSPTPSKSPTFSLFPPQANTRHGARSPSPSTTLASSTLHRPRPPRRSYTAPVASPSQPVFPHYGSEVILPREVEIPSRSDPEFTSTPSTAQTFDSVSTSTGAIVTHAPERFKFELEEPVWDMVTAPYHKPEIQPSRARKLSEPPTPTASIFADGAEEGPQVAQISIARTVSVSRAQRKAPNPGGKPMLRSVTQTERLVDSKKPLTPTLVELKNRKSQRVQLVDA